MKFITEEQRKINQIDGLEIVQDIDDVVYNIENGIPVVRFEYGDSMKPIFVSGEYAVLTPIKSIDEIKVGDAVFCKLGNYYMTHMVWIKNEATNQFLIGSSSGRMYGWTDVILAKATRTKDRICEMEEEKEEDFFWSKLKRKYNKKYSFKKKTS